VLLLKISLRKQLWRRVRGYFRSQILDRHGVAVLTETQNGKLAVDPEDFNVSRQLLTRGEYDWEAVTLLLQLLGRTSRLAVVGAHIGAVIIPLMLKARVQRAIAYEPSPRNLRLLRMNLELNGLRDHVEVKNIAVGEKASHARFMENKINTGNSRLSARHGDVEVEIDTLDATMPSDWETIDLMVMDVEGAEVLAMRGAPHTLEKTRFLYIEFAPEQLREQGSTVAEFVELTAAYFKSAYILGMTPKPVSLAEIENVLRELLPQRGLLLNILFSKDSAFAPHGFREEGAR